MSRGVSSVRCWVGQSGTPLLQIITDDGGIVEFGFRDVHALLDAAEVMRRVGNEGLRHAPRPEPR
jgi:hypothetical protein